MKTLTRMLALVVMIFGLLAGLCILTPAASAAGQPASKHAKHSVYDIYTRECPDSPWVYRGWALGHASALKRKAHYEQKGVQCFLRPCIDLTALRP